MKGPVAHTIALGVCAALTAACVVLGLAHEELVVLVLVLIGLVPATFLLLTRTQASQDQVLLWAIGAVVLAGFTILTAISAIQERSAMSALDTCVHPALEFEVEAVSTVGVEWWPPRVLCQYSYSVSAPDRVEWEQRWWIYWPLALVPLAMVLLAGTARQEMRRRRGRRAWSARLLAEVSGDRWVHP